MTNLELVCAAKTAATGYKTLYVLGCFGSPMTPENKLRYTGNLAYNRKEDRVNKILASDEATFGFDCVCFLKGLLWGWNGDSNHPYGGAVYQSNQVPDVDANTMIGLCSGVSEDFTNIIPGEVVWIKGHIGVYLGDGLAAECTHRWADGVQITAVHNIGTKAGTNGRKWTKHGRLPFVEYGKNNMVCLEIPVVKCGSRGPFVKAVQQLLIGNGFSCGKWGADGVLGSATIQAITSFQLSHKLEADGTVSEQTLRMLLGVT